MKKQQKKQRWEGYCKEKNLLQLPVFFFEHAKRLSIIHTWVEDGQEYEIRVYCNRGIPGAFEQDVYAACMRLWVRQGMKKEGLETTYTEIAKILDLNPKNWLTKVKKALFKLGLARYELKECFVNAKIKTMTTKHFSLFESTAFAETRKMGRNKEKIKLHFPEAVKENLEIGYYQWLKFSLYKRIKSGLPRRLYEYLEKLRYHGSKAILIVSEEKVCRWLPIIHTNTTNRRKRMQKIAEELIRVGYLTKYHFDRTKKQCHYIYAKDVLPNEHCFPHTLPAPKVIRQEKNTTTPSVAINDPLAWIDTIPYFNKKRKTEIEQLGYEHLARYYPGIRREYDRLAAKGERPKPGFVYKAFKEGWTFPEGEAADKERRKQAEREKAKAEKQKKWEQVKQAEYYKSERILIKDEECIVLDTKPEVVAVRMQDIDTELLK